MGKHRKSRKRNQKGGAWYNPLSWGQQDPNAPRRSWGQWLSSSSNNLIQGADNAVGSAASGAKNAYSSVFSSKPAPAPSPAPAPVPVPTPVPVPAPVVQTIPSDNKIVSSDSQSTVSQATGPVSDYSVSSMGGKRRTRRTKRMKGGFSTVGGPENLAFYASPVHGLKVASPTFWVSSSTNAPLSGGTKRRLKKRKTRRNKK